MKLRLVDDWKKFYKWWSVWIMGVMGIAHELYEQVSMMQQYIPQNLFRHLMAGLCVLAIVSRLVSQKPKDGTA